LILADTSVWVNHFRRGDTLLAGRLERGEILMHPFVLGELALGQLDNRVGMLALLADLPMAIVAEPEEIMVFVERHRLSCTGLGYVDVALLVSVLLSEDATLWTRDRPLHIACTRLGCAAPGA
jgi:predicted nucleic acid-binding protein